MQKNKHIVQILATVAILLGSAIGFSSAHASTPQQYQYQPLATIPIGTSGYLTQVGQNVNPASYIQNLYVVAFSIGAVIAVVVGVWSGVSYMLSESVTNKSNALGRIKNVGWGFALLLCSYTILDLINPQLVNFNLNLGTIDTSVQQGNLAAQETQASQLATNAITAGLAGQTAQQQVGALKNQIANCIDMQTDPSNNSASNLAMNGCNDAGVAALTTQLTTAQTNLVAAQNTAATALAAQQKQLQANVDTAQKQVNNIQNIINNLNPNDSNYNDELKNNTSSLNNANANLFYQGILQQTATAENIVSASVASGNVSGVAALKGSLDAQIGSLQTSYLTTSDQSLQKTINSEILTLQTKESDLQALQSNINGMSWTDSGTSLAGVTVSKGVIGTISSAGDPGSLGATNASEYKTALGNINMGFQYNESTVAQIATNPAVATGISGRFSSITSPDIQAMQSAYANQQSVTIQNAIQARCVKAYGTNAGC